MNEQDFENMIVNVSNDKDGFNFICYLLETARPLDRGFISDPRLRDYTDGKKDFCQKILDCVQKYNFTKYVEIMEKRRNQL